MHMIDKLLLPYRTVLLVPFFVALGVATLSVFLARGPGLARQFFVSAALGVQ